jgi:hypothetical protein
MIMEKTSMNVNKTMMHSDLHTEQLLEAITLIKTNKIFFEVEQESARDILDSEWNEDTYRWVSSILNNCSYYYYIKKNSLNYLLNNEEFLQEEGNNLIELGEEIKSFNSANEEPNDC